MMPGALTSTRRRSSDSIGPLAVDGIAERVDDTAEQALADWCVNDGAGALDRVAFLDVAVGAEDHDADIVGFEIERHAPNAARKLDRFARLDVVQAVDAGDAVTHRQHLPDFRDLRLFAEILDLILQDRGDFCGPDVHQPTSFMASLRELSLVLSDPSIMRLPTLRISPPMRSGSTFVSSATSLSSDFLSAFLSAVICASDSGSALVTSAATSPR